MILALHGAEHLVHVVQQLLLLARLAEQRRHLVAQVADDERVHLDVPRALDKLVDLP